MLDRFKSGYDRTLEFLGRGEATDATQSHPVGDVAADHDAHRAVLELLVATMFSDGTVTEAELDEIRRSGDVHGWTTSVFSFDQAMGSAIATVRDAREQENGLDGLVTSASERITEPALRAAVVDACRHIADADGITDDAESTWIATVTATFGSAPTRLGAVGDLTAG